MIGKRLEISEYQTFFKLKKLLFAWLSLVVSVVMCCPFFPRGVLDEILNLIESVSEGFPSYSYITEQET